jgi:site-specific DNA-methyltransferase (adenine-specific)
MFSFYGDTVLDPFCGTGTTMVAAMKYHRNSIGIEIDYDYCRLAASYLKAESSNLFHEAELSFEEVSSEEQMFLVKENSALYKVRPARNTLE